MAAPRKKGTSTAEGLVARGALVSFKDDAGKVRYLYAGTAVPESMPASEVERLSEAGLIGPESFEVLPGVGVAPVAPVVDDEPPAEPEKDKD